METGRSSAVYSAYSSVRSIPRTRPSELTISVTTRPQPPWFFTSRRKAESVMPAIGAMPSGTSSGVDPMATTGRAVSSITGVLLWRTTPIIVLFWYLGHFAVQLGFSAHKLSGDVATATVTEEPVTSVYVLLAAPNTGRGAAFRKAIAE